MDNPALVRLFVGMLSNQKEAFDQAQARLERRFGPAGLSSGFINFDFTDYYEEEMGKNLLRKFISFKRPVDASELADVKLFTNRIERRLARRDGTRTINLDPGYITASSLILATTKNFQHRIYLKKGIYAEVTLRYEKGKFLPYPWTYKDFQTEGYQEFFVNLWKERKNTGG